MLEWNSTYATGVPEIDSQHKVLFDTINEIEKLLGKGELDKAEANRLLEFLEQYAVKHFKNEETCMACFHCPAHEKNKVEHGQFQSVLQYWRAEYVDTTRTPEALERLHATLVWWIHNHILKLDIQLRDCVAVKA